MNKIKITAFGDSVITGTSAKLDVFHDCFKHGTKTVNMVKESQTWRSITARIMSDWVEGDVEITNAGRAGDTAKKGLARLEQDVLVREPDYVLVMFGVEDVLQGIETSVYRVNLEKIVEGLAARNSKLVLLTPIPISERMTATGCTLEAVRRYQEKLAAYVGEVRELADEKSLSLIDLYQYFQDNRLAYDHLYEGKLPDGVAQTGMSSFIAGELLPMMGVDNFPKPTLCDYRKVYSDAENYEVRHNGFTDLTIFQGEFYVAFRSGRCHGLSGGGHSKCMVLRSKDGINWVKEAELDVEGFIETRDPKFLQVEDRLMVYGVSWQLDQKSDTYWNTYGFERLSEGNWGEPFKCAPGVFWRLGKWRNHYVVAGSDREYNSEDEQWHCGVKFLQSLDGHTWETVSTVLDYKTDGSESALFVENDKLMAYSRAGKGSNEEMQISTYIPSENRWETVSSGRLIQAPCVFKAGNRTIVTGRYCSQSDEGFRELRRDWNAFCHVKEGELVQVDTAKIEAYHHGLRTGIFVMDGTRSRLVMELLSAGDSSYTGAVQYGDEYLISDYSMHEYYPEIKEPGDWQTPCDIYLSRIRFEA